MFRLILLLSFVYISTQTVYFEERFNTEESLNKWVQSKKKDDLGEFVIASGKAKLGKEDNGLKTSQDAKFYGRSVTFNKFSNRGKTLVVQFTVNHEQDIDCGGGYVKIFGSDVAPEDFHGESPYHIMFGPDICGVSTKKVHVIFSHNGKNHLVTKDIRCKHDTNTHMYRLIVKPTNEFEVQIDDESVATGNLEDDFDILPPRMIDDDSIKKPEDWVDEEMMDDPNDKKPEDWDKPKTIPDPSAKRPDDWDDEMDGEWEAAQVDNPEYKGEWRPSRVKNPAYKGPWVQPQKANPEFKEDKELYAYDDIAGIGFDLWQVKSGTIFDNLAICDDVEECSKLTKEIWTARQKEEKKLEEEEEKKRAEEMKAKAEKEKDEAAEKTDDQDETKESHDEL